MRFVLFAASLLGLASLASGDARSESPRTIVRNATLALLAEDQPTSTLANRTIVIQDGLITAILTNEDDGLKAGDLLVDAGGAWVLPGFVEGSTALMASYSECTRFPLRGVTTIVGRFGERRRRWFRHIESTAAFQLPDLKELPEVLSPLSPSPPAATRDARAVQLRERTLGSAKRFGLLDRGRIAIGARGDLMIVTADPFEDLAGVEAPKEVFVGGVPMRIAELETARKMFAEADAELAGLPAPTPDRQVYLIESSGLRVGRLSLTADATAGEEFWGPPVRQATSWTISGAGSAWLLSMSQVRPHGQTIDMSLEQKDLQIAAKLSVRGVDESSESALLEAGAEHPLLDPMSLTLRLRDRIRGLKNGERIELDVVEPVPMPGAIKVGIRTIRVVAVDAVEAEVPTDAGERVFRIESPDGGIIAWVVTDEAANPIRGSLPAPEGVTEYLGVPKAASSPQPPAQTPAIRQAPAVVIPVRPAREAGNRSE